jgi:hypothetical protein
MKFCASSGGGEELEKAFAELSLGGGNGNNNSNHYRDATKLSTTASAYATTGLQLSTNSNSAAGATRPPNPRQISSTERPNDMPNILMAMRKLREAILATQRRDAFAQRAYVFIIHASILTRHWESYQPALSYLLDRIHLHTPLTPAELQEFVGYRVMDLACRQYELGDAFAILKTQLKDRRVETIVKCLVQDDWVRFWRVRKLVDGYQRALMEFAVERMRLHALKCLGRGYMSADKAFVERTGDATWAELVKSGVGWQLLEDGKVVIRKPKPK